MSKLMNLLRRNPRMTFASIVLVIALIAVIVWLVTRGEKKSTDTGPELEVTGEKIVKSVNTSEYAFRKMEYAGEDSEHRGSNIDFTITINTKGGFKEAGIKYIRIDRYDDSDGPALLDTQYTDQISNYGTFEVKFIGRDLIQNAVGENGGDNTFNLYGVTSKGSDRDDDELYPGTPPVKLASTTQPINVTDLNYTLNNATKVAFIFDIGQTSGSTSLFPIDSTVTRTKYRISIDQHNVYSLVPAINTNGDVIPDKYKFKSDSGSFLYVTEGNTTTDAFKIDASYGGDRYRAYTDDTDDNRILTREGGTGNLVLKSPTDMDLTEAETSLLTFTPAPDTPVNCDTTSQYDCADLGLSCTWDVNIGKCVPATTTTTTSAAATPECKKRNESCSSDADCCNNYCDSFGICGYPN